MGKWFRNNQIIYVETIKGQQRMPYPQQNFPQGQPGMGQNRMRKYFNFSLGTLSLTLIGKFLGNFGDLFTGKLIQKKAFR